MRFLNVLGALFNSRKAVVALGFLIAGGALLLGYDNVTPEVVLGYLGAGGVVISVLINAIKDEDVAAKNAAATVNAAAVQASHPAAPSAVAIDANTVQVTPQSPTLGNMG